MKLPSQLLVKSCFLGVPLIYMLFFTFEYVFFVDNLKGDIVVSILARYIKWVFKSKPYFKSFVFKRGYFPCKVEVPCACILERRCNKNVNIS